MGSVKDSFTNSWNSMKFSRMCKCVFRWGQEGGKWKMKIRWEAKTNAKDLVKELLNISVSSFRLFSHVWLFVTPQTAARQASLSITNSWSLFKLMSIQSVMSSNYLILCHTLLLASVFPRIRVFSNESVLHISCPNIGASASTSILPVNIQDWFPLGWTGLISLQSKGLSRVFSNTTVQKHQFFGTKLSL